MAACLGSIWPCAVAARVRASAMLRAGGGDALAGECGGNVAADFLPSEVLGFAAGVVIAEIGVGGTRHTAASSVAASEQKQGRTVFGGMLGHG
jgi:hypothetical protein